MLDEFILGQLTRISRNKEDLGRQLKALTEEEDAENEKISQLLHTDDVGKELFSPRGSNQPFKTQLDNLKKRSEEILLQQAKVKDELEQITVREEYYREMLLQVKQTKHDADEEQEGEDADAVVRHYETETRYKQELTVILKRLEECVAYSLSDRNKCNAELRNLCYYVKALLSHS